MIKLILKHNTEVKEDTWCPDQRIPLGPGLVRALGRWRDDRRQWCVLRTYIYRFGWRKNKLKSFQCLIIITRHNTKCREHIIYIDKLIIHHSIYNTEFYIKNWYKNNDTYVISKHVHYHSSSLWSSGWLMIGQFLHKFLERKCRILIGAGITDETNSQFIEQYSLWICNKKINIACCDYYTLNLVPARGLYCSYTEQW